MREPISKISNTIKHRYLNQASITRIRKWIYLKIIGINMIVNIMIFVDNLFYRKNINNEQNKANYRASWNTMYVKIRRRQREVNIHRICSRRNNIHK